MRYIIYILIFSFVFLTASVSAELQIFGESVDGVIDLVPESSSSCGTCSSGNSTGVNESYGNTLWWRLDGTNAPPTADWDMGGFNITNGGQFEASEGSFTNLFIGGILNVAQALISELTSEIITLTGSGINMNGTDIINANRINVSCVTSKEYITYSDSAAPPNGFMPYGTSATVDIARGYIVLYSMEITSITLSSGGQVQCVGADNSSNSCKGAPTFNQSGIAINPFNQTLNFERWQTNSTSINLSYGDQILYRTFGNVVSNASSQGLSNVIVQFEAKRRC